MKITILTVSCLGEKNSDIYANLFIILKYPMSPRKLYDFKSKVTKKKTPRDTDNSWIRWMFSRDKRKYMKKYLFYIWLL